MREIIFTRIKREMLTSFLSGLNTAYASKYFGNDGLKLRVEELIGDFLKDLDIVLDEYDEGFGEFDINKEYGAVKFYSFYFSTYQVYYNSKFAIAKNLGMVDFVNLESWVSFRIWELIRSIESASDKSFKV